MSNSQEQSLDENVVFLPVTESSPEFLYCEKERQAVERLLNDGAEAFYSSIDTERSGCFLSPEEVSQIDSLAQDYSVRPLQGQPETNGERDHSEMKDFCSTYFPSFSDTPTPELELGWPERGPWMPQGNVMIYTSPPAEGEPPVREIIRRHLQKASKVIAIVTDRLTDGAIIGDLHNAASRGVPVYIILNQRSTQENFTLNRLRHPYMRVRFLGGKTFCSHTGRIVVGEMKDKFLLVDIETVIHGSYSLTWTDAHLHRQLITILSGPVIDGFDREFRILYAASLPVPEPSRLTGSYETRSPHTIHQRKDVPNPRLKKHLSLEADIPSPPSPPSDSLLDWNAMGVVQSFPVRPLGQPEEILPKEMPLQNNMPLHKNIPMMDPLTHGGNQLMERKRVSGNTSPVKNNIPDKTFNNALLSPPDTKTTENMKRVDRTVEKSISRQLSTEKSTNLDNRTTTKTDVIFASANRREHLLREPILEEESASEFRSKVEKKPPSRKPLILSVPQSESFSSLSDIIRKLKTKQSTSGQLNSNAAVSELSQSMGDLSVHKKDTNDTNPVPRFKAAYFDPDSMTPAIALMQKRNDELKPLLLRTPKQFVPRERPRSSSYALGMDWKKSLAELLAERDAAAKK